MEPRNGLWGEATNLMAQSFFLITDRFGHGFDPMLQRFLSFHQGFGYRYGTRTAAQKSLNCAIRKNPSLLDVTPKVEGFYQ